jgi:hypothetical protein
MDDMYLKLCIIILNCVYHSSNVQHQYVIYNEYNYGTNNKKWICTIWSSNRYSIDRDHLKAESSYCRSGYDATANYSLGDISGSSVLLLLR